MDEFTLTVRDPGQGLTQEATSTPLVYGPCSNGTANVLESFNSIPDLLTAHPQGPATETAAYILAQGGGPIRFMKSAASVAAANSVVTSVGGGPVVTVAGTAADFYDAIIEIVLGGALGTATFRYTLDGGKNYSATLLTPSGLTYVIPNTGITATFTAGTQIAGATHSFTCTPAMWNSTDLGTAFAVLNIDFTPWDFFVGAGRHASAAAAATVGASLQSSLEGLITSQRWVRGMIDAGNEATAAGVVTAYASTVSPRLMYVYKGLRRATPKAFQGWGTPMLGAVDGMAMLAARSLISTHLGRYLSHNLTSFGATAIDYDEEKSAALNSAKIATLRTIPGVAGIWNKCDWLKAADGSDFLRWHFGRVMDTACRTTFLGLLPFLNVGLRTQTRVVGGVTYTGTLDDREITRIEDTVNGQLSAVLKQPANIEGTPGHVTDVRYIIDKTWDAATNQSIKGEVTIVRLAYAEKFRTQLGFAAQILPLAA
ncbi:MAG TPA: DUF2586 family protein [Polyangiaceae bacterium]|nr:DUF2586 family protein [Polyangiaceae bacterium]